jgi:hypothetical protein
MNLAHHLLSCLAGDRFRPAARALAVVRETLPDLYLANLFLRGYCKLGRLQEAAGCSTECSAGTSSPGVRRSPCPPSTGVRKTPLTS